MARSKTALSIILAAAALAVALLTSAASAQHYPPTVTPDVSEMRAGGDITVSISDFDPGADVTIAFKPTLGTITADANGDGSGTFKIPAETAPGDYTLTATSGDLLASAGFTVLAVGAAPSALPRTGSDSSLPLAQTALAAIAVGGLMLIAGNKHGQKAVA